MPPSYPALAESVLKMARNMTFCMGIPPVEMRSCSGMFWSSPNLEGNTRSLRSFTRIMDSSSVAGSFVPPSTLPEEPGSRRPRHHPVNATLWDVIFRTCQSLRFGTGGTRVSALASRRGSERIMAYGCTGVDARTTHWSGRSLIEAFPCKHAASPTTLCESCAPPG